MDYASAINYGFSLSEITEIAYATHFLFNAYLERYQSPRPLSPSWTKRKGNADFWKGLGAKKGHGAFTEFSIIPRAAPDGLYYIGWFSFDVPEHFKIAADRFEDRRLLPDAARSFNEDGTPSPEFCEFMTHLAYEASIDLGIING